MNTDKVICKVNEIQSINPDPSVIVIWLNNHPDMKNAIMFEYFAGNTGNMGDSVLIACELIAYGEQIKDEITGNR